MSIKAGVWIDHRQAVVVLVTDAGQKIKRITSGVEKPVRSSGTSRSKHKYTPNDFVAEDTLQRKLMSQLKDFYDEVFACVRNAEAILVVGPGEAKGEFVKRLKSKKHPGRIVELETTDKMTDRQLAAKVSEHFAKDTANKAATTKASARKATKSTAGKRTRNSGR
jgi:stalled ribosome rescue protein Dom34